MTRTRERLAVFNDSLKYVQQFVFGMVVSLIAGAITTVTLTLLQRRVGPLAAEWWYVGDVATILSGYLVVVRGTSRPVKVLIACGWVPLMAAIWFRELVWVSVRFLGVDLP